jgi:squalene-hopene/tetraprenyl-beta-curcumene cyclase
MVELSGPPGAAKRSGRELARRIGQAVAVTDDLVDLLADWRSGAPNTILATTRDQAAGPGGALADAWVYRVAGEAAAQIVSTLRSASLLYAPRRPTGARLTGTEAAAKFATFTVARWVGWREELSPPSVFAVRRPRPRPDLRGPCAGAAGMLLDQQATGYREAIHWMEVPWLDQDRVRLKTYPATVFQRAVVLDALLDAYAAGLQVPGSVLGHEALLLLQAKRQDVRGGWSYLPGVPELPPDVDDLAMVLQVLARVGGQPLAAAGQRGLDLVLAAADRGDLTTWILDPGQEPHRNEVFRRYIELTQAGGAHPEVVANLLYAASLYDTQTGRQAATSAAGYLESAQDVDGSWPSRWYWGRHYGTYRAVAALALVAPGSRALDRARDYLLCGQHPNGGWGAGGASDPLSTAFAALALTALAHPGTGRALRPAVDYLLAAQHPDRSWPGCPFIAFPRVGGPGVHIYRSSTITTSFCLKALLACRTAHATGRITRPRASPATIAYRSGPDGPTTADWS